MCSGQGDRLDKLTDALLGSAVLSFGGEVGVVSVLSMKPWLFFSFLSNNIINIMVIDNVFYFAAPPPPHPTPQAKNKGKEKAHSHITHCPVFMHTSWWRQTLCSVRHWLPLPPDALLSGLLNHVALVEFV